MGIGEGKMRHLLLETMTIYDNLRQFMTIYVLNMWIYL